MIKKIYLKDEDFNSVLNGNTNINDEIYYLDRNKFSDEYALIINIDNKKRIFSKINSSSKSCIDWNKKNPWATEFEEFICLKESYEFEIEKNPQVIELHVQDKTSETEEITVLFVNEKGLYVKRTNPLSLVYKTKGCGNTDLFVNELTKILNLKYILTVPITKYRCSINGKNKTGQLFLIQLPSDYEAQYDKLQLIDSEELKKFSLNSFNDGFERYIFYLMKCLFGEEDIPNREVAFEDEPEIIGEILDRKIKLMHDLTYFDYENFNADDFRCNIEPYLTDSEISERISKVPKTEHNYQQMMERCYMFDCLDWALEYDEDRTRKDNRFKQYFS